jgi:hypothetical protein
MQLLVRVLIKSYCGLTRAWPDMNHQMLMRGWPESTVGWSQIKKCLPRYQQENGTYSVGGLDIQLSLEGGWRMVKEARDPRPYFRSGYGGQKPSKNQVWVESGIESAVAHETLILEAGIDFSSCTCMCPLSLSVYNFEIFKQDKSIPARNQFHGGINYSWGINA